MKRCTLCRSGDILTKHELGRFVTATCHACGAVVRVEFDPPDDPDLAGRIEVLVEPRRARVLHAPAFPSAPLEDTVA